MKRTALKRKTWLRSTRRKPVGAIRSDIWRDGLGGCVMRHHGACGGPIDAHHVVYAQSLRRRGLHHALMDHRNRVALCRFHHENHHSGVLRVPRGLLPGCVFEFAAEHGVEHLVDRHYPEET